LRRPIELIRESGLRAAAIVNDLLTVARGVAVEKEPLDLNVIVEEYLRSPEFETLSRHHPGVELACNLEATLFPIMGSRAHIRKVLMNLVANAAEATDTAGVVSITTANREIDRDADDVDLPEGRYAVMTVTDQGKGIANQDRDKIFEPFYSKKVMGRSGTGLGLTVVWNVIQDHHGFIRVSSGGQETAFTIFLPATSLPLRQQPATVDMSAFRGNGQLILVVDDIDTQRQITSSMLTQLGYRAASVADGEEAVEFVRNQAVAVVILDMIMSPGISGRETYERLLSVSPGQKALIVSGYAETDDVRETLQLGAGAFLKKPLLIKDLAIALQTLLADSRHA
jgi:CheY-like chemotaxis protein